MKARPYDGLQFLANICAEVSCLFASQFLLWVCSFSHCLLLFFFFYLCVCALGVDFIAAIFTLETFVVCAFYLDVCACMCVR